MLNIAYNILCGGQCLKHIELRRNDEVFADALGAQRIPDPTTAGDFCRRFTAYHVGTLMEAINGVRVGIWRKQPKEFFDLAVIGGDGAMAETAGECKAGMDISYKGQWGYQPLIISLNNTGEPLYLVNRSGNRPSHEGATPRFNSAVDLCLGAGFKRVLLRGDTDFTQTKALDDWHGRGNVQFIFGIDAKKNLVEIAERLENKAFKPLERKPKYTVKTQPRQRPRNVKEAIVKEREFENIRLRSEDVAEFDYAPGHCRRSYRVVVVRKNLTVERGEWALFDDVRYFFYITNNRTMTPASIVQWANGRCNQEKLIGQLKGGVGALDMPVDNLVVSNRAYMVMASLAWSLKAWYALSLPECGRWGKKYKSEKDRVLRMEFQTFRNAFMNIPTQVIRTGRRIVYRVLAWNQWLDVFLRGARSIGRQVNWPLRC